MTVDDSIPAGRNRAGGPMKSGCPAGTVPVCREWVEANPDEDSQSFALAWALHDSGKTAEAAACFERLFRKELARKIFTGFAYDELVRIYREGKNGEALVSVCERAAAAQPEDTGILQTLGEAYISAGRAVEAARVFEKLAKCEPDAPEHRCSLGDALLAAGDPVRAEAEYKRAVEIDPAAEVAFFSRLANGFFRAGDPERAKAAWENCLAARSDEPLSWMGLGDCLVRLGEPDAAADAYGRAAELQPAAAGNCWHRLGRLLATEGLHSCAEAVFAKAIAAEPKNPLYLLRLAASYAAQGQNDLAAAALRRVEALKSSPAGR
ncbi:MAG: tetratricopeptide repeat protein [Deltaproteobacteria bacterium]|nr:tetratricopeptide repeat protein [Deltaproteobacteria bacterium]